MLDVLGGAMVLGALLGGVGSPKVGHESVLGCFMHCGMSANAGVSVASECCGRSKTYCGFSRHGVLLVNSDCGGLRNVTPVRTNELPPQ